ncbi:MAG TPA: zinc ribbon domain-containing protein [Thermoplasmata archaeon]|nr:zinc ribbon domain-containing protein [Thermoplasmata archaeon]
MVACPQCGEPAAEGALFCQRCGRTLPQFPPTAAPLPPPPPEAFVPPFEPPPPVDWIPETLRGRAVHCPRCNSLISAIAVVCPVCRADQPPAAGAAGAGAPP